MPQALALVAPGMFAAGGSAALFTGLGGLTLAGSAVSIASSLLLSTAANALLGRTASTADPENVQQTLRQSIGARVKHYGEVQVGGTVVFYRAKEGKLYRLIVHGHGRIDEVTAVLLDDKAVSITAELVTDDQYQSGGRSRVRYVQRVGTDASGYYGLIEAAYPAWDSTHQLKGLWTSLTILEQVKADDFREVYPKGEPELKLRAKTSRVSDPRAGVAYSDNAALIVADWITSADGFNLPGFVDADYLEDAADDCDDVFALADASTEPRYRIWGSADLTEAPERTLERMLSVCQGRVSLLPNGKARVSVGKWLVPSVTLDESEILEISSLSDGPDRLERYTELPFVYTDKALQYRVTTGDTWVDDTRETENGEIATGSEADYRYCPSHTQGRRLAQWQIEKDNPRYILTARFKPSARVARFEDYIGIDMPMLPDVYWSIEDLQLLPDGTITMTLHSFDPPIWSTALEGNQFVPPEGDVDRDPLTAIGVKALGSRSIVTTDAGIAVSWQKQPDFLVPVVEFSPAGLGDWVEHPVGSAAVRAFISPLVSGDDYDVRVALEASDGLRGEWVTISGVTANTDILTVAAVTDLAVADNTGGTAEITFTTVSSVGLFKTEIIRDAAVVAIVYADPSTSVTLLDSSGAGTFDWTARSVSLTGNLADSAVTTQTIT